MAGVLFFQLPYFGVRRLTIDKHGSVCASMIVLYWVCGNSVTLFSTLLPLFNAGHAPLWIFVLFLWVSVATMISFVNASTSDPGIIALPCQEPASNYFNQKNQKGKSKQPNDEELKRYSMEGLTDFEIGENGELNAEKNYCDKCEIWRPSRAHHCRRCGVCIRQMDHHCPWINNCVGALNLYLFLNLLVYAFLLSIVTMYLNLTQLLASEEPESVFDESTGDPFIVHRRALRIFCCLLSGAMITLMISLYFQMHYNLLNNESMIEVMRRNILKSAQESQAIAAANEQAHAQGATHQDGHDHGQMHPPPPSQPEVVVHNASAQLPPKPQRQKCSIAYQKLCGRRPLIAWLLPLELWYPPPATKTIKNINVLKPSC